MDAIAIGILAVVTISAYFLPFSWQGKWIWFWTLFLLLISFIVGEIWSKVRTGKTLTQNLNKLKREQFWIFVIYAGSLGLFFLYCVFGHIILDDDPRLNSLLIATVLGGSLNALAGRGVKENEAGPKHIRIILRLFAFGFLVSLASGIIGLKWYWCLVLFGLNFFQALPMTLFGDDINSHFLNKPYLFLRGLALGTLIIVASIPEWYLGLLGAIAYAILFGIIQLKNLQKEGLAEFSYGAFLAFLTCLMAFH